MQQLFSNEQVSSLNILVSVTIRGQVTLAENPLGYESLGAKYLVKINK